MENNVTQAVKVRSISNSKIVKTLPHIIQRNQNKEIILKSSGSTTTNNLTQMNQKVMLKVPNNGDTTKSNFKIIPLAKSNDDKTDNGKNKVETKSIKLNPEQMKNIFGASLNSQSNNVNGALKKPIILSMDQLKGVLNNPNIQINKKSIQVLRTNPNTPTEKLLVPKASALAIKTYSRSLSNSMVSTSNLVNIDQQNVEKSPPAVQTPTKNQTLHIQASKATSVTSKLVKIDPQKIKALKLNTNQQNVAEKSSPVVQTLTKNQTTRVQVSNSTVSSSNSVNTETQPIKTIKLNQDNKTSPIVKPIEQLLPKQQKFILSPNNRFRIINQNGKKIALPIGNLVTNPKLVKATPATNENTSKSVNEQIQNDKTPKAVTDDKNTFVFDSMTLPIGARKIYTRRPKTPEHVYKKFHLPISKPIEPTEPTKTVEKQQNSQKNQGNQVVNEIINHVVDHTADAEKQDESIEKKKKLQRKRTTIDFEAAAAVSGKSTPVATVNNKSSNGLIQTLKSKFVPLVGHACTATIIEHINLAYSRCRVSHLQAVRELIQYIENYERYRDRKLLETQNQNTKRREKSTQTLQNCIVLSPESNENIAIVEEHFQKVPNSTIIQNKESVEQRTVGTSIVPDLSDEFSMFKLQLYKDWNSATVADVMGNMPIHNAVLENDFHAVKRLCLILKHLKNINIQNESYDMTALHLAIMNNCDLEIIQHLLDNGVSPEIEDINGNNCLHMISQHGNATIMELLLTKYRKNNLDLNTSNYNGSTPLMLCTEHNNVAIAKLLLRHRADTEVQDLKSGRTVLFQAIEANNESMVKLLIEHGADPKKRDYSGITPLEVISEIRISPGIRKIMYKILSQNIVNLQRKRQRQFVENCDDDVMVSPITSSDKIRRINEYDDDEDDET